MGEKAVAPPALVRFVREYVVLFDRYDGNGDLAGRGAIATLTTAERTEILRFCRKWLATPVPPKQSGEIRMVGLGRFRMSRAQLGRIRDALVAIDARLGRKATAK